MTPFVLSKLIYSVVTVLAINTFYTVLQDADNNYINIPNSLFFQKYIRVVKSLKAQNKA